MKTEKELKASASAAVMKALKLTHEIKYDLAEVAAGGDPKLHMPRIRNQLAELNQRVHEFNAYDNALTT